MYSSGKSSPRLLLIDDDPHARESHAMPLREAGICVEEAATGRMAMHLLNREDFDVVLRDQSLGETTGIELMSRLGKVKPHLQFIIMTEQPEMDMAINAMKHGATDLIRKPCDIDGLRKSIEESIERRDRDRRRITLTENLEKHLLEFREERKSDYLAVLESFSHAVENRDHGTYGHSRRVCAYSCRIAKRLSLPHSEIESVIKAASLLHDIGKICISDFILGKAGPLTDEERAIVRRHPQCGAEILLPFKQLGPVAEAVLHHHERFDGGGYPDGIAAERIPLVSRIIAVADTYDAICSTRPYRQAETAEQAIRELTQHPGTQFDRTVTKAMIEILAEMRRGSMITPFPAEGFGERASA